MHKGRRSCRHMLFCLYTINNCWDSVSCKNCWSQRLISGRLQSLIASYQIEPILMTVHCPEGGTEGYAAASVAAAVGIACVPFLIPLLEVYLFSSKSAAEIEDTVRIKESLQVSCLSPCFVHVQILLSHICLVLLLVSCVVTPSYPSSLALIQGRTFSPLCRRGVQICWDYQEKMR